MLRGPTKMRVLDVTGGVFMTEAARADWIPLTAMFRRSVDEGRTLDGTFRLWRAHVVRRRRKITQSLYQKVFSRNRAARLSIGPLTYSEFGETG